MSGIGILRLTGEERVLKMEQVSSTKYRTHLTMSQKERAYLSTLIRLEKGDLRCADAAESLGISERHIYRLRARYRAEGDEGLVHRLRGSLSNRGYSLNVRTRVIALFRERYSDYGPTYFAQMIAEEHADTFPLVDHNTLGRWLRKAGLWSPARIRKAHRRKRLRREKIGSLVQFDGSDHDWFEGRGPQCCLLNAIDDASSRNFMRFAPSENTRDVLLAWKLYVERYGIPCETYTDKAKIYHPESKGGKLTEVGRALTKLGVKMILAHSPQAKGRVERSNRTHQDRLVKALRRRNISTIEAANRFLEETYLDDHNRRYAHTDGLPNIHRSADGIDLRNIFCFEATRCVHNDYTITLDNHFIQLERSAPRMKGDGAPLPPPGRRVTVRRWLDDSLHIFWNEEELSFTLLPARPVHAPSYGHPAKPDHPWRQQRPIGKARRQHRNARSPMKSRKMKIKKSKEEKIVSYLPTLP